MRPAPKCIHLLSSYSKLLDSIISVIGLLRPQYRQHNHSLPHPHTPYLSLHWVFISIIPSYWLASLLLCFALVITYGKDCEFSTWWVVQTCIPVCHGMKNLERRKELSFKLYILHYLNLFVMKQNFFAGCVAARVYDQILSSILQFLCLKQVLREN